MIFLEIDIYFCINLLNIKNGKDFVPQISIIIEWLSINKIALISLLSTVYCCILPPSSDQRPTQIYHIRTNILEAIIEKLEMRLLLRKNVIKTGFQPYDSTKKHKKYQAANHINISIYFGFFVFDGLSLDFYIDWFVWFCSSQKIFFSLLLSFN